MSLWKHIGPNWERLWTIAAFHSCTYRQHLWHLTALSFGMKLLVSDVKNMDNFLSAHTCCNGLPSAAMPPANIAKFPTEAAAIDHRPWLSLAVVHCCEVLLYNSTESRLPPVLALDVMNRAGTKQNQLAVTRNDHDHRVSSSWKQQHLLWLVPPQTKPFCPLMWLKEHSERFENWQLTIGWEWVCWYRTNQRLWTQLQLKAWGKELMNTRAQVHSKKSEWLLLFNRVKLQNALAQDYELSLILAFKCPPPNSATFPTEVPERNVRSTLNWAVDHSPEVKSNMSTALEMPAISWVGWRVTNK